MNRGFLTAVIMIIVVVIAIAIGNLFLKYILGVNLDKVPDGALAFFHALMIAGVAYLGIKLFGSK